MDIETIKKQVSDAVDNIYDLGVLAKALPQDHDSAWSVLSRMRKRFEDTIGQTLGELTAGSALYEESLS